MDLELDENERAFRERLVEWLDATPVPDGLRDYGATPEAEDVPAGRAWQRLLYEGGWAGLSWPREHGGAGATLSEQAIFTEELSRRSLPRQLSFVSMELAGPAIIAAGSAAQRDRYVGPMLRGEEIWCQLFSEPGAGSDLAAIACRARRDGDGWVVSGQKIWTSAAQYSGLGMLLARTDSEVERHRGITCFLIEMDRPGILVNPIRQIDGESKFNEVFLDGLPVTPADVLGEVDNGWRVALSILGRERRMLGSQAIGLSVALTDLRVRADERGEAADAVFRDRWAELWGRVGLLRWTWLRLISELDGDDTADPRMSVLKLTASQLQQDVAELAADVLGADFVAGAEGVQWRRRFLAAYGASIAGGTSEIQRTILAERVLGLPRG
jgi:alkylation response protein AidB-like acyl-CoA dehydrogenase